MAAKIVTSILPDVLLRNPSHQSLQARNTPISEYRNRNDTNDGKKLLVSKSAASLPVNDYYQNNV